MPAGRVEGDLEEGPAEAVPLVAVEQVDLLHLESVVEVRLGLGAVEVELEVADRLVAEQHPVQLYRSSARARR